MAFLFSGRLRIHQVVPSSFSTLTVLYSFHNDAAIASYLLSKFTKVLFEPSGSCQADCRNSFPRRSLFCIQRLHKAALLDLAQQTVIDKRFRIGGFGLW